ncbi:regulatory protein RecX [Acutalibacter sp. 1XD8-33]|uniref:regulatory protein RecX n=1 Tax=Acutalibacter sp. 1XD8-33 TaxID=2320081 RepID=UPI000EA34611|nr:regulatory protein RecX [Acutalibacter sp. 1XD8-33]RKJ41687.1 regulatory protein RecX [Acutalibacter sp. 1XD8-33]
MEITAAEPRRKSLLQLYIDGEAAVKIDRETFLRSGLKLGDEITDEELHELIQASDARRANEKALYLLEHRNHTKKELAEKIARTAASREAAQAAANHMEELGLIDDEAYARDYAREMFQRKRYGPMRVKQELRQKGVESWLIDELLEEYGDGALLEENLRAVLERKYSGWQEDEKIRRRAFGALQRMGYTYEQIRQGMAAEDEWG